SAYPPSNSPVLLLLDEEHEILVSRRRGQKRMPGLVRERVEILDRSGIRRDDLEHLARGQLVQRFLGLEDGQWTREPARVEFLVEVHATSRIGARRNINYSPVARAPRPPHYPIESLGGAVGRLRRLARSRIPTSWGPCSSARDAASEPACWIVAPSC